MNLFEFLENWDGNTQGEQTRRNIDDRYNNVR